MPTASGSSLWVWASIAPRRALGWGPLYESSPRIFFTKAAMSVFLVLCKVKKGCSWGEAGQGVRRGAPAAPPDPRSPGLELPAGRLPRILLGLAPESPPG